MLTSEFEVVAKMSSLSAKAGVPVVSTDAGGARETFVQDKTGFLVEDDSPESLAKVLIKAINDKDWLKQASIEAKKMREESFPSNQQLLNLLIYTR